MQVAAILLAGPGSTGTGAHAFLDPAPHPHASPAARGLVVVGVRMDRPSRLKRKAPMSDTPAERQRTCGPVEVSLLNLPDDLLRVVAQMLVSELNVRHQLHGLLPWMLTCRRLAVRGCSSLKSLNTRFTRDLDSSSFKRPCGKKHSRTQYPSLRCKWQY